LREEPIGPSSNPPGVIAVTSVSGDVLLSSFQSIDRKKKPSEERSIVESTEKEVRKGRSLFPRARRPVRSVRIREATFPLLPKRNSKRPSS
jgi:hypothetical protein